MKLSTTIMTAALALALLVPATAAAQFDSFGATHPKSKIGQAKIKVTPTGRAIGIKIATAVKSGKADKGAKPSKPHGRTGVRYIYIPGFVGAPALASDPDAECQASGSNCTDEQMCRIFGANCALVEAAATTPAEAAEPQQLSAETSAQTTTSDEG